MTEQEQIEVWRKQFQDLIGDTKWLQIDGNYAPVDVQNKWLGFLMAKQSMPVIELPRPNCTYADHSYPAYTKQQLIDLITAAGYQYKIKGE